MLDGYTQEQPLAKEEKALFGKVYKGNLALRPVSAATQAVAGINYSHSKHIMRWKMDILRGKATKK